MPFRLLLAARLAVVSSSFLAAGCGPAPLAGAVTGLELAHYVPTPLLTGHRMLTLAGVGPDDVVYDLGSGDGRLVILAASEYGARGVGVEIDVGLVALSRAAALEAGVADRVRFIAGDLMAVDLREATVVLLYLAPSTTERLRPRFLSDLRPGARIVSHSFSMGSWPPDVVESFTDEIGRRRVVYLWRISASSSSSSH